MVRHLEGAGFRVTQQRSMTILHSEASIARQVNVGRSKLKHFPPLAKAGMEAYLDDLEYVLLSC